MKNFNFGFISALIVLMLLAFTCKKEETPVKPATKGSIKGTVINNKTEQSLANAVIYTQPGSVQITTDQYGEYIIKDVVPKDYKVFCYKQGYDTLSASINVAAGVEAHANFRLNPKDSAINNGYGNIEGSVRDFDNQKLLEKVTIKTIPATSVTITNDTGKFKILNVSSGSYKVIAEKKDYETDTLSIKVRIGTTTEANFNLRSVSSIDSNLYGRIKGKVSDKVSDKPVQNVRVYTVPATNSVTTNSQGEFIIENVLPSTYKVIAEKNGYLKDSAQVVVKKRIDAIANLSIKSTTGILEGIVIKKTDGAAINRAIIKTDPVTTSVVTGIDGKFVLKNLSPVTYKIITSATSFVTDTTTVVIKEGATTSVTIVLNR